MNPGHLSVLQFSRLLASAARAPRHFQLLHRVPPAGIEPATVGLKVRSSNQLSYRGLSSPGPLARAHAQGASGGTVRAAVCEGIQRPAHLHYQTVSVILKRTQRQTHTPGTSAITKTLFSLVQPRVTEDGAHCGPCRTRTCGVDWLPVPGLQPGAFAAQPTTHETRERPVLGDECRTSLPRVSSGSRTRTCNPTVNSRLRCLLRHAGMMKTLCSSRSVRLDGIEPSSPA